LEEELIPGQGQEILGMHLEHTVPESKDTKEWGSSEKTSARLMNALKH
jgi:hypothetical protein